MRALVQPSILLPLCTLKNAVIAIGIVVLGAFSLHSCTEICDAPDVDRINAIFLKLDTSEVDGFSQEELDSLYMVRYFRVEEADFDWPHDTVYFFGNFYQNPSTIRLSNDHPFTNDSLFFPRYNYAILFKSDTLLEYRITNITLDSKYIGDCAYENKVKTFDIDGVTVNKSGTTDTHSITK